MKREFKEHEYKDLGMYYHFKDNYYVTLGLVKVTNKKKSEGKNIQIFPALHTELKKRMYVYNIDGKFYLNHSLLPDDTVLVCYKSLNPTVNDVFLRPLDMFMSEVDKEKYPNVEQTYRFELVK